MGGDGLGLAWVDVMCSFALFNVFPDATPSGLPAWSTVSADVRSAETQVLCYILPAVHSAIGLRLMLLQLFC